MRHFAEGGYLLAVAFWAGGLWAIGYLVAPLLFSTLADRQLAGAVAGKLFAAMAWFGLAAAFYLAVFLVVRWRLSVLRRAVFWLILLMATMSAIQLFGIQPLMEQLKQDAMPREVMASVLRDRFAAWHGVSSILYLVQSLLGAWLVVWSGRGLR